MREKPPKHRWFDDPSLDTLLNPGSWSLISPYGAPDVPPLERRAGRSRNPNDWHRHAGTDVMIVLGGNGRFGVEQCLYPARAGTVFFVRGDQEHHKRYPPHIRALWISVLGDSALCWLASLGQAGALLKQTEPVTLGSAELGLNLDQAMAALNRSDLPARLLRVRALVLIQTLVTGIVEWGYSNQAKEGRDRIQRQAVQAIMAHIRLTGGAGVTLDSLTHVSGYSKYYLHRLFKKHAGQTVGQYIDCCRRDMERDLLARGQPRKAIAAVLGFSSPQAYSRWSHSARSPRGNVPRAGRPNART